MTTRYTRCAAPGCAQRPRKFSRYCRHHAAKLERTRDLNGRVLTKGELKADRADALDFILKHRHHPAIHAALEYMADLIAPQESAGFLRKEFARLRSLGATPEAMLASVLALYLWAERVPEWKRLSDRCFDLNLGRAALGTVPAARRKSRAGKTYYVRVRPGHAEALGENLRLTFGALALTAAKKMLRESGWYAPDERGRLIREAIEAAPFEDGDQTPEDDETK